MDQLPMELVQALHETVGNSALLTLMQGGEGRWTEREAVSLPPEMPDLPPVPMGDAQPALSTAPDFSALPPMAAGEG